jgi:heterodisulfide reductase subunit B
MSATTLARRYLYYPGCSLKGTGRAYETSLLAVFRALGVELLELDDWNCCGATAYMSVDEVKAFALSGRNLALAERQGLLDEARGVQVDLIAPCSACYLVLNKTQAYMSYYPKIGQRVSQALQAAGLHYKGSLRIRHPLDVLVNDVGLDEIALKVKTPLKGLKVAPYYGCQIVRPFATFDDRHNPVTMDRLLGAVGAEVVDYPLKTSCCGGSLTGNLPKVGVPLVHALLDEARKRGADVVATVCPLCQFNLDAFQERDSGRRTNDHFAPAASHQLPVVYFTQLLGLALGIPARELGLQANIVPAEPVLAKRGVL